MPQPRVQALPADEAGERLRRLCALQLALQEQARVIAALRQRVQATEASRSWKLTAPLRRLRRWLQREAAPAVAPTLQPVDGKPSRRLLPDTTGLLLARLGTPGITTGAADPGMRQLFVDVTELAREDLGAGIQRVVNRLLVELMLEPPAGFRVEPVRLAADGRYAHARGFLGRLLGLRRSEVGADVAIAPGRGDVFLALDLIRDHADLARPALQELRGKGARLVFVVYDLLPVAHPEWFPSGMDLRFARWLQLLADTADVALCISADVREQLRRRLADTGAGRPGLELGHFPLGAELSAWTSPEAMLPPLETGTARFLVVGTIEPRKGHQQTLAAFEQLWAAHSKVELVIAGHVGWAMDDFVARLRGHPEAGARLHWIEGGDDAELSAAYRESTVLLAPSLGEGFGLPLVEAAAHGRPLLVRDIRVFREVAGAGANYFAGEEAGDLVRAIGFWLQSWQRGELADPRNVLLRSWRQSADSLRLLLSAKPTMSPSQGYNPMRDQG